MERKNQQNAFLKEISTNIKKIQKRLGFRFLDVSSELDSPKF